MMSDQQTRHQSYISSPSTSITPLSSSSSSLASSSFKPIGSNHYETDSSLSSIVEQQQQQKSRYQQPRAGVSDHTSDRCFQGSPYGDGSSAAQHEEAAATMRTSWQMMILSQSTPANETATIVSLSSAATNHERKLVSSQQTASRQRNQAKQQADASEIQAQPSSETADSNNQQLQQKYNFQYQDEMSRRRERLFRLLSKVPIHVETEPVAQLNHEQEVCQQASTSQQHGKSSKPMQSKVIDREPLIIKYYKDRTLSELIEHHFGCSLIKHNYDHREPLTNQLAAEEGYHQRLHPRNHSDRAERGSSFVSGDEIRQQQVSTNLNGSSTAAVELQAGWQPSVSLCGAPNQQLVSWHHLSMDKPAAWRRLNLASESSSATFNGGAKLDSQSRQQHHRRNLSSSGTVLPPKAKSETNNKRLLGSSGTTKSSKKQLSSAAPQYLQRASIPAHQDHGANEPLDGGARQATAQYTYPISAEYPRLKPGSEHFAQQLADGDGAAQHFISDYQDSAFVGNHHFACSAVPIVSYQQQQIIDHSDGFIQNQSVAADAGSCQQQPLPVGNLHTLAGNSDCTPDWPSVEGQLLPQSDMQHQQHHYADAYYPSMNQLANQQQPASVMSANNWNPSQQQQQQQHQIIIDNTYMRLHMIEQQQQPTSETNNINNINDSHYDHCSDMARPTQTASTITTSSGPLYSPHSNHHHQHTLVTDYHASAAAYPVVVGAPHQHDQLQLEQQHQLLQYQQPPTGQEPICMAPADLHQSFVEATNLSGH